MSCKNKKLNGGILPMVLGISILLASIIASLILMAYYFRLQHLNSLAASKINNNIESGINYLLGTYKEIPYNIPVKVDLFGSGNDTVEVEKKLWGIYEVVTVLHKMGNQTTFRTAYTGYFPKEEGKAALSLTEDRTGLTLSGSAYIKGDCYLRNINVHSDYGNITNFQAKQLDGTVHQLNTDFFDDNTLITQIKAIKQTPEVLFNLKHIESIDEPLFNSFKNDSTLFFESKESILIETSLKGNIIVCSEKEITIEKGSKIEDVIFIAPYIIVNSGASGNFQLFATDSILVNPGCELRFPSSLVIISDPGISTKSKIILEEKSLIQGQIIMYNQIEYRSNLLKISKDCLIQGHILINGYVDHSGTIEGGMICKKLISETSSGINENYLKDAKIVNTINDEIYLTSRFWPVTEKMGILKWID